MKHSNHHEQHAGSTGPQLKQVRFEFTHPTASTVFLAGTFNDWHAETKPMHPMGGGHWLKQTTLAPGTYEYCLVVDGQWIPDPLASETVPNPFGGRNSVLQVAGLPETANLADAAPSPLSNANNKNPRKI